MGSLLKSGRLILATAAHVLRDISVEESTLWRIQQFDDNGQLTRSIEFEHRGLEGICVVNKKIDIAFIVLPKVVRDGTMLSPRGERTPPVLAADKSLTQGTRVGWVGFASAIEELSGRPHLCYFEGSISTAIYGPTFAYVVDGHNSKGVSGGPVWHWPFGDSRTEIVGVVSGYLRNADQRLPGFCIVTPINPLIAFLSETYGRVERKSSR